MRRVLSAALVAFAVIGVRAQEIVDITLTHGTPAEAQTKDQLRRLLRSYDVSPWIFTRTVNIDERAIPHSHPVLTLHTRHLKDDDLLLSTFVHEELHWFLAQHQQEVDDAIVDLRAMFPSVPTAAPEGASGETSTYLHLLVCYLEDGADQRILGELRAHQITEFWSGDHYTWVYRTVRTSKHQISQVLAKHKLFPPPPGQKR